jgi:hypothetical protein
MKTILLWIKLINYKSVKQVGKFFKMFQQKSFLDGVCTLNNKQIKDEKNSC